MSQVLPPVPPGSSGLSVSGLAGFMGALRLASEPADAEITRLRAIGA